MKWIVNLVEVCCQQQSRHRLLQRSALLASCLLSADRHGATFTATLIKRSVSAKLKDLKPQTWTPPRMSDWAPERQRVHRDTHQQNAVVLQFLFFVCQILPAAMWCVLLCVVLCTVEVDGWGEWADRDYPFDTAKKQTNNTLGNFSCELVVEWSLASTMCEWDTRSVSFLVMIWYTLLSPWEYLSCLSLLLLKRKDTPLYDWLPCV